MRVTVPVRSRARDHRANHHETGGWKGTRQRKRTRRARLLLAGVALVAPLLALGACGGGRVGTVGYVEGFSGVLAADEPQAVLIGRDILSAGGLAGDAAVAMGFSLAVTLPSAAGLGGGGLCLAYDAEFDKVQALDFLPDPAGTMAVPALARGMFALHARHGSLRWESLLMPAETLARFGAPVSRALVQRLPTLPEAARDAFPPGLAEGDRLVQHDLAAVLGRLRQRGAGTLHDGLLARETVEAVGRIGHGLTIDALRRELPQWHDPATKAHGNQTVYGAYLGDPGDPASAPAQGDPTAGSPPPATGFVVADSLGNAVACTLTMGRPFGTGEQVPGQGYFIAPPEAASGAGAALALTLSVNHNVQEFFLGLAAAGGQAPALVARATEALLAAGDAEPEARSALPGLMREAVGTPAAPAFLNAAWCPDGVPPEPVTCAAGVDPRGAGYGLRAGL